MWAGHLKQKQHRSWAKKGIYGRRLEAVNCSQNWLLTHLADNFTVKSDHSQRPLDKHHNAHLSDHSFRLIRSKLPMLVALFRDSSTNSSAVCTISYAMLMSTSSLPFKWLSYSILISAKCLICRIGSLRKSGCLWLCAAILDADDKMRTASWNIWSCLGGAWYELSCKLVHFFNSHLLVLYCSSWVNILGRVQASLLMAIECEK